MSAPKKSNSEPVIRCKYDALVPIAELKESPYQTNQHTQEQIERLAELLVYQGCRAPVIISNTTRTIAKGHATAAAFKHAGWDSVPVVYQDFENDDLERAFVTSDNAIASWAHIDLSQLNSLIPDFGPDFELKMLGLENFKLDPSELGDGQEEHALLTDKFLVPPFTVLDARQGYWQDRKREWLDLGIESEIGRGENLLKLSESNALYMLDHDKEKALEKAKKRGLLGNKSREGYGGDYDLEAGESAWGGSGTSIFDPVLCEIAYRWFCPANGLVLDPFAGGSVRGITASKLKRHYHGVELRTEQVLANRVQAEKLCKEYTPVWHEGDSAVVIPTLDTQYDFLFTCPPYGNLEVYSQHEDDISNLDLGEFDLAYREIIFAAVQKLANNRFAAIVVGDYRGKEGFYCNFVSKTIDAFECAGALLYNEAILVTAVGSLPLRCGRPFEKSRKLGKTHQNVLVFCKGDPVKATEACGKVDVTEALSSHKLEAQLSPSTA